MNNRMLNEHLRGVPRELLEDHVLDRIKHFAVVFAQELVPGITQQQLDLAFSRALYSISAQETSGGQAQLELRFNHSCRFMGCSNQDCQLCKNNPHKTCTGGENFDEAYADNQILKARCEAEVHIELVNQLTGEVFSAPGVEVQLSVIDGDAFNPSAPEPLATIVELHTSDEGVPLLQCYGTNRAIHVGTVVITLQNGKAKLPDVYITDKNDTFHFSEGATTGHFRLLALAMRRDELGNPVPVEGVGPAVSNSFVVKTQRALNDYRKSAYPHYKDELTRLRYIGAITATRLKDARAWLGKDVPLECVDTVQKLKQLLEYADNNRPVEQKLLELLNMRGRHRHKWDFLRNVLSEKVVYDDNAFRVWYAPEGNGCGLLYSTKQAQIQHMDKPAGVARRVVRADGSAVVQVMLLSDINQHNKLLEWRKAADEAWKTTGHPGWNLLQDEIEYVSSWPSGVDSSSSPQVTNAIMAGGQQQVVTTSAAAADVLDHMDEQTPTPPAAAAAAAGGGAFMAQQHQQQQIPPAAAAASSSAGGGNEYPHVCRQQLEVQHQLQQQQHEQQQQQLGGYPHITPALHGIQGFGAAAAAAAGSDRQLVRPHSTSSPPPLAAAAAADNDLVFRGRSDPAALAAAAAAYGGSTAAAAGGGAHYSEGFSFQQPGRTLSDMSMTTSGVTAATQQQQQHDGVFDGGDSAAADAAASAFMVQHPFDAVEVALAREAMMRRRDGRQRDSSTSGATTATEGDNDAAAAAAAAAARVKRGRSGAEVHAVADPDNHTVLFTTESRGRHQPMARTAAASDAFGRGNAFAELVSLTPEDLEALQWAHSDRQEQQQQQHQQNAQQQQQHMRQQPAAAAAGLEDLQEEEEFVADGLPLTSTFSAALRIADASFSEGLPSLPHNLNITNSSRQAAAAAAAGGGLPHRESDSFKRILGDLGVGSLDFAGMDAVLLAAPSAFLQGESGGLGSGGAAAAAGDSAAAADQQKNRPPA